ncbi:MAG: tryptophan 7-halogenase [Alphaproteobacteria bacterium]|nr:tryptophan 7-halogenase [Alphaproteobacteria bacterium]MBO6629686.1 tryptophan 7-halogenase [Alphaproteobacteria bacterium]
MERCEVAIIGAGPAGAVAAANLARAGHHVIILEREIFPRFSIGESLLPQCMEFLEEAGLLGAVQAANFQFKNGAAFEFAGRRTAFNFEEKFSEGWGTTFQVQRARFDKILADGAAAAGADVRYRREIVSAQPNDQGLHLEYVDEAGTKSSLQAKFCLDASGFGRVLPRLLGLHRPSDFPVRRSYFTHIKDAISPPGFDRNKILITVHPLHRDVWFWLIPFADGTSSIGVVAAESFFGAFDGDELSILQTCVEQVPALTKLLENATYPHPVRFIGGYSAKVSSLHGQSFALLGNAGEFLDPVFSSGVTIALKSASLAVGLLSKQIAGESVDWEGGFAVPLSKGVDAFRHFVSGWYSGELQDVIFTQNPEPQVQRMICSILAGYVWDEQNPYVAKPRRLAALAELCRGNAA